jgi:flagellar hook-associated protein 2
MTAPLSSISGLISGVDTASLIDAIIAQDRAPAVRMEAQETSIKNQQTTITAYRTALGNLEAATTALQDGSAFGGTSVTSQASGTVQVATATGTPGAVAGQYQVQVSTLAAAEKLGSSTALDATTPLGHAGTFTINGQSVTMSAADTLATLRDQINALNSGTSATGVSASILTVSATDSRLVLTSAKTGEAGATLADTTGTALQSLGFLDNTETKLAGAILAPGSDAHFTIDNIAFTRTSNTVADAIEGLTVNLVAAQAGATSTLTVARDSGAATQAMQTFVTAYNAVIQFVQAQGTVTSGTNSTGAATTSTPALYGDSLIRSIRSGLPQAMLQTVFGAPTDLATAASVGLSLSRDGTISLDSDKFTAAFTTRLSDVQQLFGETLSATSPDVSFVSSGAAQGGGTYAVNITQAATVGALSTSGFSGTYDAGATPDTLTLNDTQNGSSAQVQLTTGMTTADIVAAIQSAITTNGLAIDVGTNGNDITLTHQNYGSTAGLSYGVTGLGDGASEAFGASGSASGTNVMGTIGGYAATGSGQTLVGNSGSPVAGLTLRYAGATTGAAGDITLGVGTMTSMKRLLDNYINSGSGLLDQRADALSTRNDTLVQRVADIDTALARERLTLVAKYAAMEAAIASLRQSVSSLLGNQSNSSTSSNSNSSSLN